MRHNKEPWILRIAGKDNKDTISDLFDFMKTIKGCGDYSLGYWNEDQKTAWWSMADSDGADPYTTSKEIKDGLMAVPGVKKVIVESESSPDSDDSEWEQIFPCPKSSKRKVLSHLNQALQYLETTEHRAAVRVLDVVFNRVAQAPSRAVCPHCGSDLSREAVKVEYCDSCDSSLR